MSISIGLDIGGTKIAGASYTEDGRQLDQTVIDTPHDVAEFLNACRTIVDKLDTSGERPLGIGIAGRISDGELADASPNMPFLKGCALRQELEFRLKRKVRLANDANCMALAEATDGAGAGFSGVFGLTLGTGVGGGFVFRGHLVEGANGLAAEIGHIPLPFRDETDGPVELCGCKQHGCLETSLSGPGLARLYTFMTGKQTDARAVAQKAQEGDTDALHVLERYFESFAKGMVSLVHTFDPDVIVVSGSLNALPGLYEEVPKRWGKYAYTDRLSTRLVPARHGALSGLRGAALLGSNLMIAPYKL